MSLAVTFYDVVKTLHIVAVVVVFGLPFVYPVMLPYLRRNHPASMGAIHAMQAKLGARLIAPGLLVILIFGAYLATDRELWDEPWVSGSLVILIALGGIGGAVMGPSEERLAKLAPTGGETTFSPEYEKEYAKMMRVEYLLVVLTLVAIFLMTAKPFS